MSTNYILMMFFMAFVVLYRFLGLTFSLIITLVSLGLYFYVRWENNYFKSRGVKSIPSYIPILSNMAKTLLQREHVRDFSKRYYDLAPDDKYVGTMQLGKPVLMIRDLELIKLITIKDFDHFSDHAQTIDENTDPLFGNNLVALKGQKWRDMRATLSPAFTSAKMRGMFDFVIECGDEMVQFFKDEMDKPANKGRGYLELDMKDTFTRYTNDVIATSAFGIKVNSLKNRENQFFMMGKEATNFTGSKLFTFFLIMLLPKLSKFLGIKILNSKVSDFYRKLVTDTMQTREEQHIIRPDMIQLLMDAKKGSLKHDGIEDNDAGFATVQESNLGKEHVKRNWTDDEIIAQAVIFFLAGFETSSNLLCFVAHELAANPDVHEKLQAEVDDISSKNNGKITYNDLQDMKYMDMVVTETLRRWPPGVALDRKCVKEYTLPPPNDSVKKGLTMKPGDGLWIPLYDIHHDPQYYDNPHKFDPERFSEENMANINPIVYLPFGVGPRNCIGSRFALMECKAIIFQILQKFDFIATAKTEIPIQVSNKAFNFIPKGGFWVGIKPRKSVQLHT